MQDPVGSPQSRRSFLDAVPCNKFRCLGRVSVEYIVPDNLPGCCGGKRILILLGTCSSCGPRCISFSEAQFEALRSKFEEVRPQLKIVV